MTSAFGLLTTGFVPKPQPTIRDEINAALRGAFGASIKLGDKDILGQIVGIISERYALLWELGQQVYSSEDPDAATFAALDAVCALTGTIRELASASTVALTLCGVPGSVIASGSRGGASNGSLWATDASATIAALLAWTATTAYGQGDRVTRASRGYQCITAGTSGSSGPSSTDADITDGTVHWRYIGEGVGAIDAASTCTTTGPVIALSGDISTIKTPVLGWQSVRNLADAKVGRDVEVDGDLRVRRENELATGGNSPPDAIRADVLATAGVTGCTVFYNPTDVTDADGVSPHSVEVMVQGGTDADVAATIFASVAAGIGTVTTASPPYSVSVNVIDSEGALHTIKFSRPTPLNIYVDLTIVKFPAPSGTAPPIVPSYPTDGDTQITTAITTYGAAQPVGRDVSSAAVGAQAFKVDGVLDVTQTLCWTSPISVTPTAWTGSHAYTSGDQVTNDGRQYVCITSGTSAASGGPSTTAADITDGTAHWRWMGATIVVTSRQIAVFDSSRVTIHSTNGTP